MAIILFLTGLICIGLLFGLSYKTYQKIDAVDQKMASVIKPVKQKQKALKEDIELYTAKIEKKQAADKYLQQRAQTEKAVKNNTGEHEHAPEAENTQDTAKPSVFNQVDGESADNTSSNGHIVGIDPGHQSENIDMSATEPNGPGSSTMKAKASTGTSGSFSGLPEYQLNLNVSLLLRDILEQRGYQVVMTRTDNDTAISNKERAELVASKGAEICVRIHANGDDSSGVSGALTMCPSQQNPYVSSLYDSSNRLSRCIIDSYCAATGFQNRGIIYTDSMTGINWSTIPVTIVEMGFMTNQNDDLKMADSSFQQTMAEGIANGVDAYFQ
ncbi:N-acetylmuramoyl-L-alanine amidase [Blautia massiliensis]|nr:N-acetylmuramoyl-L-alanine amidase [Blautia massiliensis (ex Durand et al. 2017)]